ncbi:MAG TPA: NFACT RNA binding domain-containing protein [Gemmatimonadaceae bacterium]|nr:NFACT RNA binding domain-containing protein [Gemmatimonadaceae bacterium]
MDSLTARYLAEELDALWRGHRVRACIFDAGSATVVLSVDGSEPVEIDLSSPDVHVRFATLREGDAASDRRSQLGGWSVGGVKAPVDDRRLVIELVRPGRFKGSAERRAVLSVSAIPNARGAELRDAGGHRLATLGARIPPRADPRPVPDEAELARAVRERDERALLEWRWMSGAVARWLLDDPERAAERYALILSDAPPRPAWCGAALLPFPMCSDVVEADTLIEPPREPVREVAKEERSTRAARSRTTRLERARARMEEELERAREAPALRAIADALAPLGDEPAPLEVTLANGRTAAVEAKPGESARDAAERLYAAARSMERALELLPERIAKLERDANAAEAAPEPERAHRAGAAKTSASLPYRRYRSSTGLEIRVGRGAAANDELTFRESSPNDVWLHARESAGAHVVLRWQEEGKPPARALEEAAVLAALHSKSRGAALVPVDWTRRKYVRRARGGAPGSVIVQRSRTVMVRPDAALEKKLREP